MSLHAPSVPRRMADQDGSTTEYSTWPTTEDVAGLTRREIELMDDDELVELLLSMRSAHLQDDLAERVPYLDRSTLERLAFLTRLVCQNRLKRTEDHF